MVKLAACFTLSAAECDVFLTRMVLSLTYFISFHAMGWAKMARNILIERLPNNSYALLVPGSRGNTKDEKFVEIELRN